MTTIVPTVPAASPAIASPTMATPRPAAASLGPIQGTLSILSSTSSREPTSKTLDGHLDSTSKSPRVPPEKEQQESALDRSLEDEEDQPGTPSMSDGRLTPLASDSGVFSHSGSSAPSEIPDPSPMSTALSLDHSQPVQPTFNTLPVIPAEVGLSTLPVERQLREAMFGKDRMFLLLLSREIEAFIGRIVQGVQNTVAVPQGTPSSSVLASLGPSMILTTVTTSKYQRMLAYKTAEWYGLKGIALSDGAIVLGVVGTMNEKTPSLKLSDVAPKPSSSPKQSFQIMQRASNGANGSGDGMTRASNGDDAGPAKRKTLEEREAEYALARERIYGKQEDMSLTEDDLLYGNGNGRGTPRFNGAEEIDPIPRYRYNSVASSSSSIEPVYASLYQPVKSDSAQPPPAAQQYPNYAEGYYQAQTYPGYPPSQMPTYPGHVPSGYVMGQQMPLPGAYPSSNYMGNPYAMAGEQWQQQPQYPAMYGQHHPEMTGMTGMAQTTSMPPMGMTGHPQGWYTAMFPSQTMPMIPQGMPYAGQQGYPPNTPHMYPNLAQPTPLRPGPIPHAHSSNSSSISSRSYQDISRPHSRGSTTSTRSAASSVRLGYMFPAGSGQVSGYRQKGLSGTGFNGMTNLKPTGQRNGRGQSPSSTTTTSSRSSKRGAPLRPPAPGQHQLPQRPDWAANNVPYHPLTNLTQNGHQKPAADAHEFPPLGRNGTNAEPMQVERVRLTPAKLKSTSVWNSGTMRLVPGDSSSPDGLASPGVSFISPTTSQEAQIDTPLPSDTPQPPETPDTPSSPGTYDDMSLSPDGPVMSAEEDGPIDTTVQGLPAAVEDSRAEVNSAEVIEAKLAALSVSSGISIGPPPIKTVPSYAKIVRQK